MLHSRVVKFLLSLAQKERSGLFKAAALALGGLLFLGVIPWCLIGFGEYVTRGNHLAWPLLFERLVGTAALLLGLFWLGWAVWVQVTVGRGTPNPTAPPQKLITSGPYGLSRNPIQFGVMLYYSGLGTLFVDFGTGLVVYLLALVFGSLYHRFIEEEELKARFGADYEAYRKKTPFLYPRLWRRKN